MPLFLALIVALTMFYFHKSSFTSQEGSKPIQTIPVTIPDEDENANSKSILEEIISNAQIGKASNDNIIAGKTNIIEVTSKFGEPNQKDLIDHDTYLTYMKQAIAVGYNEKGLVFEVRSYNPSFGQIHYHTIKDRLGNPSSIRYSKDKDFDQIILIYHLKSYQLKFILPRPTNSNPNPVLNHTSIYFTIKEEPGKISNVDKIINKMTLDEKIGQMIFAGFSGKVYSNELKNLVKKDKIGGILFYSENMTDQKQTVNVINSIKKSNVNNPLPILFGVDQEGGRVTRLPDLGKIPTNKEIGMRNDSNLSYQLGKILGEELKLFGFTIDFAPVLDINSNPNNPVIGDRSFGNNPSLVSKLGIQTMKGIRSENVISVIKHFPGHGDTSVDSHLELPVVYKSYNELNSFELIPFKNAIQQNADVIMVAHILLPKIDPNYPSSMSKEVMTTILRNKLHYQGIIMTDDMTMNAIQNHYKTANAAVKSVQGGSDIVMVAHNYQKVTEAIHAIKAAVTNGTISEERINQSVKRIFELKEKYKVSNNATSLVDTRDLVNRTNQLLNQ